MIATARSRRGSLGHAARVALAFAVVVGSAATAAATVMVEVPIEDMTHAADLVVHGVVERSGVRVDLGAAHPEPHTITIVRVIERLRGASDERIEIDELGGEWQYGGQRIDGTPVYAPGSEVVVFLRRLPDGRFRTYAMAQGHFEVIHGVPGVPSTVVRHLGGMSFARWQDGAMRVEEPRADVPVSLEQLLDFVRGVVAQIEGRTP